MHTVAHADAASPCATPGWAMRMRRINDCLPHDAIGGPRSLIRRSFSSRIIAATTLGFWCVSRPSTLVRCRN
jgi:hypothetical protein